MKCENCGKRIYKGQPFDEFYDNIVTHKSCPKDRAKKAKKVKIT